MVWCSARRDTRGKRGYDGSSRAGMAEKGAGYDGVGSAGMTEWWERA